MVIKNLRHPLAICSLLLTAPPHPGRASNPAHPDNLQCILQWRINPNTNQCPVLHRCIVGTSAVSWLRYCLHSYRIQWWGIRDPYRYLHANLPSQSLGSDIRVSLDCISYTLQETYFWKKVRFLFWSHVLSIVQTAARGKKKNPMTCPYSVCLLLWVKLHKIFIRSI